MTMRSRSRTWPIVASRNFTLLILLRLATIGQVRERLRIVIC
jgi:hypothetical protein